MFIASLTILFIFWRKKIWSFYVLDFISLTFFIAYAPDSGRRLSFHPYEDLCASAPPPSKQSYDLEKYLYTYHCLYKYRSKFNTLYILFQRFDQKNRSKYKKKKSIKSSKFQIRESVQPFVNKFKKFNLGLYYVPLNSSLMAPSSQFSLETFL